MNRTNEPPQTAAVGLAQATPRMDVLSPASGTGPRPPDFSALLRMAETNVASSEAARNVRRALACFRAVAQAHGFAPLLTELAILNDELLHLALEAGETRIEIAALEETQALDERLQFVSVLASYLQFGTSDSLLRAWRQATAQVVDVDKRAIVGEMDAYQQAFIWDRISAQDVQQAPANAHGWDGEIVLGTVEDDQDSKGLVTVGLPMAYSLGAETIRHIQNRDPRTDEARKIAHHLIQRFLSAAKAELTAAQTALLSDSVLLIVPFARPWLFGDEVEDRPGGGVFMLCRVLPHALELHTRLRSVTQDINWFLFRAAVLEAQQQRYSTREIDLTQFSHMVSRHLRAAASQTFVALELAKAQKPQDAALLQALGTAEGTTRRLEQIGEIARKTVLIRSGREVPYQLTGEVQSPEQFRQLFTATVDAVMRDARTFGLREDWRRKRADDVTHHLEAHFPPGAQLVTDERYLNLVLYEIYRNALEHGGFDRDHKSIDSILHVEAGHLYVRVSNPMTAAGRKALAEMLRRRRLLLGLTQIELLAQAYGLPLPKFDVGEDAVSVTCVVGLLHRAGPARRALV
jgi:signal transduction histidine kinase